MLFKCGVVCLLFVIFAVRIDRAVGEVVKYNLCDDSDAALCEIKELRVDPCKESKDGTSTKPCKIKRSTNATIEFDYVLHFDSDNLVGQAYSASLIDLPLIGMERNACKFTPCPVASGQQQTYTNVMYMSPSFPLLSYTVKWRIWDAKEDTKGCCLTFKIKLTN